MAAVKTPNTPAVALEDRMTYVTLPLLEEEKPGTVDQTEVVQMDGKNHNRPLVIRRGERVEIPIWAFEVLVHTGRYVAPRSDVVDKEGHIREDIEPRTVL